MCEETGGGGNLPRYDALNQHHLLHDCTISLSAPHTLLLAIHLSTVHFQLAVQASHVKASVWERIGEVQRGKVNIRLKRVQSEYHQQTVEVVSEQVLVPLVFLTSVHSQFKVCF